MLSEVESYEITEWIAYYQIKAREGKKDAARAEAAAKAKQQAGG